MEIPSVFWKKTLEEDSTSSMFWDGWRQERVRVTGNLILVAPLIDTYLHNIRSAMKNKLGRGRGTELQSSVPVLVSMYYPHKNQKNILIEFGTFHT